MSPAILYFVTTTSSAIVGSASATSGFSAIFGALYRLRRSLSGLATARPTDSAIIRKIEHTCYHHLRMRRPIYCEWVLVSHRRLDSMYLPKRATTFTLILVHCTPTHSEHASIDGNSVADFTWQPVVASWQFTWHHFHCNQQFVYLQHFLNIRGCYDYPVHYINVSMSAATSSLGVLRLVCIISLPFSLSLLAS